MISIPADRFFREHDQEYERRYGMSREVYTVSPGNPFADEAEAMINCPECGEPKANNLALAAHRERSHAVAGKRRRVHESPEARRVRLAAQSERMKAMVAEIRVQQGLPEHVEDPATLSRVAEKLADS